MRHENVGPLDAGRGRLLRLLGVGFGLAVIVGSTLGVGILRTPGLVAAQLSTSSTILTVWLIGGLYTLLGSICLTELGTMLPLAGGYYVYARRAFSDVAGFTVGWTDWLAYCAVLAYVSIAMGEFAAVLVPSLAPWITAVAIGTLVFFGALQSAGLRLSSRAQEITTAIKCLAFLALVVACFEYAWRTPVAADTAGTATTATFAGIVVALQSIVITYGGWQSALYFTEEDRDPARNLPRSMIGGVLAVIAIYLLVNAALLAVLPVSRMAGSTLAAADAADVVFGGRGRQIITALSLVSLPPLINAVLMIATRILFGMGRDRLIASRLSLVTPGGAPVAALALTTGVAAALVATGTFQKLVAVASFFLAANYGACCLALIRLRWREPATPRPFRAWGYPWTAAIVVAGAALFLAGVLLGDTMNSLVAVGLIAAGLAGRALVSRPSRT